MLTPFKAKAGLPLVPVSPRPLVIDLLFDAPMLPFYLELQPVDDRPSLIRAVLRQEARAEVEPHTESEGRDHEELYFVARGRATFTLDGERVDAPAGAARYTRSLRYMLPGMSKHLIDLDEDALSAARAELGTMTIKDTVNQALRLATERRRPRVTAALDTLGAADLRDRADAWR